MTSTKQTINELKRLMGQDDPKRAPLPELSEVLYVDPAPGGEQRNCSNCILWQPPLVQCAIHENAVEVTADHVCGYHIFGAPSKQWKDLKGLQPVKSKFSGLTLAKGGTACESCEYFTKADDEDGVCAAVMKRNKPAHVKSRGCCTRWTARQVPTDPKDA